MTTHRYNSVQEFDDEIRKAVALTQKGQQTRTQVAAELAEVVAELAVRNLGKDFRVLERRRDQLELSLRQIDAGFSREDGYYEPVAHLFPYPGLVQLDEDLTRLRRERAELAASLAYDPRVTKPYRVVPIKPGSDRRAVNLYFYFGATLRKVQVGDVINLDSRKAAEYHDFLEAVQEEQPLSASPDQSPTTTESSATS